MPTVFELFGLRFFFFSEDHPPFMFMWKETMTKLKSPSNLK